MTVRRARKRALPPACDATQWNNPIIPFERDRRLRRQAALIYKDKPWVLIKNGLLVGELPPTTTHAWKWDLWERHQKRNHLARIAARLAAVEALKLRDAARRSGISIPNRLNSETVDTDPLANISDSSIVAQRAHRARLYAELALTFRDAARRGRIRIPNLLNSGIVDTDPLANISDSPIVEQSASTGLATIDEGMSDPSAEISNNSDTDITMKDVPITSSSNDNQGESLDEGAKPKFTNPFDDNTPIEHIFYRATYSRATLLESYEADELEREKLGNKRRNRSAKQLKLLKEAGCRDYHNRRGGAFSAYKAPRSPDCQQVGTDRQVALAASRDTNGFFAEKERLEAAIEDSNHPESELN